MNSLRNRMLAIATVALAAICASAVPASAQAAFQGSFTLNKEVRWQNATLPAGDYSFTMNSASLPAIVTLNGPNGYQIVTALVVDRRESDESSLIVEHRGKDSFVRELYLAEIGVRIGYHVPKAPKDKELAQVSTERVLVAMK